MIYLFGFQIHSSIYEAFHVTSYLSTCYSVSGTGAYFSEVPKLFGRISGDIILYLQNEGVSKHENLQLLLFLFLFPLQHMKRPASQNK